MERSKTERIVEKNCETSEAKQKAEAEKEAKRQLDVEVMHQKEEAERRALGKGMIADAEANRPSFTRSALDLLVNYQG